jgi:hypothetical protein
MGTALVAALSGTSIFLVSELMVTVLRKEYASTLMSMSNLAEVLSA